MTGIYRGLDTDEGWIRRELAALRQEVREQASARRLSVNVDVAQADIDSIDLGTSLLTNWLITSMDTPIGYTYALVNLTVTAGTSFAGTNSGNISVQPFIGTLAGPVPGAIISSGKNAGGAISVSSTLAAKIEVGEPTYSFNMWARASAMAGSAPNTGNVHLSASVLYVRG